MKKFKQLSEQHREKGRFKPTIPHNVPNVLTASPKKVNEDFGKATPSVEEVAKKHGVSVEEINKQLEMGIKIEKEHTNDSAMAKEIALDHLNEKPNYYSKLKKYVEMTDVEYQSAGTGARTLVDKPNREPMKTLKNFKKEEVEQIDELSNELLSRYKDKAAADASAADKAGNFKRGDKRFSGVVKATNKQFAKRNMKVEEKQPPFEPEKTKQKAVAGKYGSSYSTVRHLARQAMKKQVEKMKPVKESLQESRKADIVKEIVKKKKNDKDKSETFQKDPVLSSEITKA